MHAVIIDGDVSYPPTSGKRLRTLHLMLRLAKRPALEQPLTGRAIGVALGWVCEELPQPVSRLATRANIPNVVHRRCINRILH